MRSSRKTCGRGARSKSPAFESSSKLCTRSLFYPVGHHRLSYYSTARNQSAGNLSHLNPPGVGASLIHGCLPPPSALHPRKLELHASLPVLVNVNLMKDHVRHASRHIPLDWLAFRPPTDDRILLPLRSSWQQRISLCWTSNIGSRRLRSQDPGWLPKLRTFAFSLATVGSGSLPELEEGLPSEFDRICEDFKNEEIGEVIIKVEELLDNMRGRSVAIVETREGEQTRYPLPF